MAKSSGGTQVSSGVVDEDHETYFALAQAIWLANGGADGTDPRSQERADAWGAVRGDLIPLARRAVVHLRNLGVKLDGPPSGNS